MQYSIKSVNFISPAAGVLILLLKLTNSELDNLYINKCNENCKTKVAWLSKKCVNIKLWKGWRFNIITILLMIEWKFILHII